MYTWSVSAGCRIILYILGSYNFLYGKHQLHVFVDAVLSFELAFWWDVFTLNMRLNFVIRQLKYLITDQLDVYTNVTCLHLIMCTTCTTFFCIMQQSVITLVPLLLCIRHDLNVVSQLQQLNNKQNNCIFNFSTHFQQLTHYISRMNLQHTRTCWHSVKPVHNSVAVQAGLSSAQGKSYISTFTALGIILCFTSCSFAYWRYLHNKQLQQQVHGTPQHMQTTASIMLSVVIIVNVLLWL